LRAMLEYKSLLLQRDPSGSTLSASLRKAV
jgi:hypothetical protein